MTAIAATQLDVASTRSAARRGVYNAARELAHRTGTAWRMRDSVVFDDRRQNRRILVCVLAGHKPELWPLVMPRLARALPPDADVCLVTPGVRPCAASRSLCAERGWSYLGTGTNDVSLAQNICLRLHPAGEVIVKVDEDMFLLPDTITALLLEREAIRNEGLIEAGFVAPMIPLNGFCYSHVIERLGLAEAFERRFGRVRLACSGIPLQLDPAVAEWIWEQTSPLSALAERLRHSEPVRLLCPIRFSIGLIVYDKSFWRDIRGFPVLRHKTMFGIATLGADEAYLCSKAIEFSRPMVVTTAAVAGHFSFGPQYRAMTALLERRPELFTS